MKINKYKRKKLEQFIVKEVDYYQYVFNEFDQNKRKVVINFAVLFWGCLWFFYRKMYVIGTVLLLSPFVLFGLIIMGWLSHSFLSYFPVFFTFVRIIESFFANRLYWYKWNEFVASRELSKRMLRGGGVNVIVPILVVGFLLCFTYWLLSGMMQGMRHT